MGQQCDWITVCKCNMDFIRQHSRHRCISMGIGIVRKKNWYWWEQVSQIRWAFTSHLEITRKFRIHLSQTITIEFFQFVFVHFKQTLYSKMVDMVRVYLNRAYHHHGSISSYIYFFWNDWLRSFDCDRWDRRRCRCRRCHRCRHCRCLCFFLSFFGVLTSMCSNPQNILNIIIYSD